MVGDVPKSILKALEKEYGPLQVTGNEEEGLVNIQDTEWYQSMMSTMTPGKTLRAYRTRENLTQAALGEKIGGVPRQHISGMEQGSRPIGKEMAKKLGESLHFDYRLLL
jgi:DNA-binding XRE family transcriptional regulator